MKTCFSDRKTDETIWKSLLSKRTCLSTNPPFSEQFFHDTPLCPNLKKKQDPPPPNFMGRGNYNRVISIKKQGVSHSQKFRGKRSFPNLVNSKTS